MPRKVTGYHDTHDSHVYVFVCGEYCKVGVAVDIEARLATLSCGNPYGITCHAAHKVNKYRAKQIEKVAHSKLAEFQHEREWFTCAPGVASDAVLLAIGEVEDQVAPKVPPRPRLKMAKPQEEREPMDPETWGWMKKAAAALEI